MYAVLAMQDPQVIKHYSAPLYHLVQSGTCFMDNFLHRVVLWAPVAADELHQEGCAAMCNATEG